MHKHEDRSATMRKTTTLVVTLAILFSALWLALGGCTVDRETDKKLTQLRVLAQQ